jgi:hypothetical protein
MKTLPDERMMEDSPPSKLPLLDSFVCGIASYIRTVVD